jgi:hypothetical protein
VLFSDPRTIGAESLRSAVTSSPEIVTCAVIGTSQTSTPSEPRWSVNEAVPSGQLAISCRTSRSV